MCRSNATKGIEHTDVSYKRPEGPPKPPLLQGQRWLPVGRWEPFRKDDLRWKQTVACSAEARKPSRFSWPHDRRRPPVGRGIDRSRPCSDAKKKFRVPTRSRQRVFRAPPGTAPRDPPGASPTLLSPATEPTARQPIYFQSLCPIQTACSPSSSLLSRPYVVLAL